MATYRVKAGDTLGAVAARFKTTVDALAKLNKISNPNSIRVGQVLTVPDGFEPKAAIPGADLKSGMKGPAVKQLQEALVKLGHMSRAEMNTGPGIFGPRTEAALKEFQARHGVPATGFYGPLTRAAMKRVLSGSNPQPKPPTNPQPKPPTTPTPAPAPNPGTHRKPPVKWVASPNYNSRNGTDIDTIVLHHTASSNASSDIGWFRNPKSQVSAHYLVDRDGTIYQLVGDEKRAWHAGKSALHGKVTDVNSRSIGIEIVNDGSGRMPFTEAQYAALSKLVPYLKDRYKVPTNNIVGHKDVAIPKGRKNDPAPNFDWGRIRRAVA